MEPKELETELCRIATKLNNSKSPSKSLVLNELNRLVHKLLLAQCTNNEKKSILLDSISCGYKRVLQRKGIKPENQDGACQQLLILYP